MWNSTQNEYNNNNNNNNNKCFICMTINELQYIAKAISLNLRTNATN